jgi:DnaJ-domain-containing protein 1
LFLSLKGHSMSLIQDSSARMSGATVTPIGHAHGAEAQKIEDMTLLMHAIGVRAREAMRVLSTAPTTTKNEALHLMAKSLRAHAQAILNANMADLEMMKDSDKVRGPHRGHGEGIGRHCRTR